MADFMQAFVHDPHTTTSIEETFKITSKLLENLEETFINYHMHNDMFESPITK